jgi:hypothetical protein
MSFHRIILQSDRRTLVTDDDKQLTYGVRNLWVYKSTGSLHLPHFLNFQSHHPKRHTTYFVASYRTVPGTYVGYCTTLSPSPRTSTLIVHFRENSREE